MNIEHVPVEESTIEDFATKHNLTMKVIERENPGDPGTKFYARFFFGDYSVDVVDRIFLKGEYGNGRTEQEAIKHYAELVSLATICLVRGDKRKDIKCPRFIPSVPKAPPAPATDTAKGAAIDQARPQARPQQELPMSDIRQLLISTRAFISKHVPYLSPLGVSDVNGVIAAIDAELVKPLDSDVIAALNDAAKGAAKRVRDAVLHHIDVMYPEVAEGMGLSARKSIGNFIMMEVETEVEAVVNSKPMDRQTPIIEAAQRVAENYFLGTNNTKRNVADDFRALESLLRNTPRT